jgi:hypothetical protein
MEMQHSSKNNFEREEQKLKAFILPDLRVYGNSVILA